MVKTDINGARRAGMTSILRKTNKRQNAKRADHVIDRIADLPDLIRRLRGDHVSASVVR